MSKLKANFVMTIWRTTGKVSSLFKSKPKNSDLEKMEFSHSAQKTGLHFDEKIRGNFRSKWIKKN